MTVTYYLWLLPGRTPPPGYVATDTVSVWPDTGAIRSRLYMREVVE